MGLKIYYLRTREKQLNQKQVAEALGIRQATVSYVENDVTAPQWGLMVRLCRFFDVTPTYLADNDRSVVPRPTERWGLRNSLVTLGMTVSVTREGVRELGDGTYLCQLQPGADFFDAEAAALRADLPQRSGAVARIHELFESRANAERQLEATLAEERSRRNHRRKR